MKIKKIQLLVETYESPDALPPEDRKLLMHADKSLSDAYAPYSQFRVGAAVRLSGGKILSANNQENAAYPSGMCAERIAMFFARAQYPEAIIETIAISAQADEFIIGRAVSPCGACRQVMAEYQVQQDKDIRVLMKGERGPILAVNSIDALLPLMFHAPELKKKK
jgi:cytidine deaminase